MAGWPAAAAQRPQISSVASSAVFSLGSRIGFVPDGVWVLVVVARQTGGLCQMLVSLRPFQNCSAVHLAHQATLDLLPWGLRGRKGEAAGLLQYATPRRQLRLAHEHIGSAETQIDPHPIPGPQQRQTTAGGGFG